MIKAVLFDLDGVLIDSYESTASLIKDTLEHFALPIPTTLDQNQIFGLKTREMLRSLIPQLPEQELEEMQRYLDEKAVVYANKITLFPHVESTLKKLQEHHSLGLVTARSKSSTEVILQKYNFYQYFVTIIDREDVANHKPHPESLLKALDELAIPPQNAVYIGDMAVDSEAAQNAGATSITIAKDGDKRGAKHLVKDLKDLPALIKKL